MDALHTEKTQLRFRNGPSKNAFEILDHGQSEAGEQADEVTQIILEDRQSRGRSECVYLTQGLPGPGL